VGARQFSQQTALMMDVLVCFVRGEMTTVWVLQDRLAQSAVL
jgi:hypothetical protein